MKQFHTNFTFFYILKLFHLQQSQTVLILLWLFFILFFQTNNRKRFKQKVEKKKP